MVRMMSARAAARKRGLGQTAAQDEAALNAMAAVDPYSPSFSPTAYAAAQTMMAQPTVSSVPTAAYTPYFIGGAVGVAAIAGLVYFLTR
jgi:hypothetical protein